MFRKLTLALLLGQLLSVSASCEELRIRNRPFTGVVKRLSDDRVWVEFKPLMDALTQKVTGDDQSGYLVGRRGEAPGAGKISIQGTVIDSQVDDGLTLVALEQVTPLLGLTMKSKDGVIDLSPGAGSSTGTTASGAVDLSLAPYTLIEWGVPEQPVSQYVKPAIDQARQDYHNIQFIYCNAWNDGAVRRYAKYRPDKGSSYPYVLLLDREGKVLFGMLGNHVIKNNLAESLKKNVDVSRR